MTAERDPRRIPVLVGAAQRSDRATDLDAALDSQALAVATIHDADQDAGGGFLPLVDAFYFLEPAGWMAPSPVGPEALAELGIHPAFTEIAESRGGEDPVRMLNDAANRIGAGETTAALIAGAASFRTFVRKAAQANLSWTDRMRDQSFYQFSETQRRYGLDVPVAVYPLYENATRAAWGQSLVEGQAETGAIYAGFSRTAVENPAGWIRKTFTAEEIVTPSPNNRPISFPYLKFMVANIDVNQGAALIVTSLAKAREMKVPPERIVYVGLGAATEEPDDCIGRDRFDHSTSLEVALTRTLALNQLSAGDLDHVELYSCFPCVPKMARRVLDWPLEKPHSAYGGLTFGGGPGAHPMMLGLAALYEKLCETGRHGLLLANGGFCSHHHAIVLSRAPEVLPAFPQNYDYRGEAAERRGSIPPSLDTYEGAATIETYVVPFDRGGLPGQATILARTPEGARFLCRIPASDQTGLQTLISGEREPVGRSGTASADAEGFVNWQFA